MLQMIAPIERAIKHDRVTALAGTLSRLAAGGAFESPDLFAPPSAERYSRRLIWRDPESRFIVVGLTWLPGQSSPLHDHAGLWGAEIIVRGSMRETTYRLTDRHQSGQYRFVPEREREMHAGAAGILIPPLEYHDFGNGGTTIAHSVHIYSGDLSQCKSFAPEDGGWWNARRVELAYDV